MTKKRFTCTHCGHNIYAHDGPLTLAGLCRDCFEKARAEHRHAPPAVQSTVQRNAVRRSATGIGRELFDRIKNRKHPVVGFYASWAIWVDDPKDDLRGLNPDLYPELLGSLRNDVVMVGLNPSAYIPVPLRNFHGGLDGSGKLRLVFKEGTSEGRLYRGAYMTDFAKIVETTGQETWNLLNADPSLMRESVEMLLEEFNELGSDLPTIVTYGKPTHHLVRKNVPSVRCRCPSHRDWDDPNKSLLIPLGHYSAWEYNNPQVMVDAYRRDLARYGDGSVRAEPAAPALVGGESDGI